MSDVEIVLRITDIPGLKLVEVAMAIERSCNKLTTCFEQNLRSIDKLAEALHRLTVTADMPLKDNAGYYRYSAVPNATVAPPTEATELPKPRNRTLEAITNIGSGASIGKNTYSFFKRLPGDKTLKTAFDLTSKMSDGVQGFTDALTKGNMTATEYMTVAKKIVSGATAVAEAFALGGPVAAIATAAVITAGTIMSVNEDAENKKKLQEQEQVKRSAWVKSTFAMTEHQADNYIKNITTIPKPTSHQWHMKNTPLAEVVKSYGADAYTLNIPVPMAKTDQPDPRAKLLRGVKYEEDAALPLKQSFLEETSAVRMRLLTGGAMGGRRGFEQAAIAVREQAKQYDAMNHTHTLKKAELVIKESAYNFLRIANGDKIIYDKAYQQAPGERSREGRTIIINLNKSLIQNFTIHTAKAQDSIADLKQKVEEVLIEILHNENVIH
ncbi:MAG: hypothetical protein V4649_04470 [Bacteroidota bacterium]